MKALMLSDRQRYSLDIRNFSLTFEGIVITCICSDGGIFLLYFLVYHNDARITFILL